MPDADTSKFSELAFEQSRKKGVRALAQCTVLRAMTERDDRYRKAKLRNCTDSSSDTILETALRREVPNFERDYAEAQAEFVRASARIIGRDLASLSLLGGYTEKPREVIEDEKRRLIGFYPEAELWIAEQRRIQVESKTRLR